LDTTDEQERQRQDQAERDFIAARKQLAADIDTGERFRMVADAATNTREGQQVRDLAGRIAMLELETGGQDDPAHRAYVVKQQDISERISATTDPAERADLRREKLAHTLDYAAQLGETAFVTLGADGQDDEAHNRLIEATARREAAANLRGQGPENTPPEHLDQDLAEIGRRMAEASGLGSTAHTAAVVDGPDAAEQRGKFPDPHEIRTEAGQNDYAVLRAATADNTFEGEMPTPLNPANSWLIMPVAVPDGGLATIRQPGFENTPTDYKNGPTRPGTAAAIESLAETRAVAEQDERVIEDERIALAAEKEKRAVEDTGRVMGAETADTRTADITMSRIERAQLAAEREQQSELENVMDTGRSAIGGGRGL